MYFSSTISGQPVNLFIEGLLGAMGNSQVIQRECYPNHCDSLTCIIQYYVIKVFTSSVHTSCHIPMYKKILVNIKYMQTHTNMYTSYINIRICSAHSNVSIHSHRPIDYIHACTHARTHTHTHNAHTGTCTCTHIRTQTYVCIHTYTRKHIHVMHTQCTHRNMHTHPHIHTHTYIHPHTQTHAHTHTCTHTHINTYTYTSNV